jgi:hypothetical protein
MTDSNPPKSMPSVSLRLLNKIDGPIEGYETVIVEIQVPAGALVGPHSRRRDILPRNVAGPWSRTL